MLRDAMRESRKSFKETLNAVVRAGLGAKQVNARVPKFTIKARPLGLRSGINPASFNKLTDDLEGDTFLEKNGRVRTKKKMIAPDINLCLAGRLALAGARQLSLQP